jgi:AcrR family transcriptional regulator
MSAPRTARERIRGELTKEILAVARTHLARDGGAALSLRSIARDLEMAPSALYRYFDGRDALPSALILEAYNSLADAAERTSDGIYRDDVDEMARWMAVPRAMRSWALARPHEWGLIFGSPVPGYQAPEETVEPYSRLVATLVRPAVDAQKSGHLTVCDDTGVDVAAMARALAPVQDALLPHGATATVQRLVHTWATLVGLISLEVFGHWRNTVLDPELFFDATVREAGLSIGLSVT